MAQAQSKNNKFAVIISVVVVVVLIGLGVVVVWLNNRANDPGPAPSSSEALDPETGGISFGDGEDTVAVFVDFQCPICKAFEDQYGAALEAAVDDGRITLVYHPIAILDRFSQGTEYSSRSAGAAICVAESNPDQYLQFAQSLFTNQPPENTTGLPTAQLAEMAVMAGAEDAESCILDETYRKFGVAQADRHDIRGTPTVEVNGDRLDLAQTEDFNRFLELIQ